MRFFYTRAMLFVILFNFPAFSQQKALSAKDVKPLTEVIAQLQSTDATTAARLQTLVNNVQPSVFLSEASPKVYGQNPVCLITDVKSFAFANSAAAFSSDIEIVTFKMSDPKEFKSKIDLAVFSAYPKLRYIYILSETNASASQLAQMLKNADSHWIIIYAIIKPS